MKRREFLMSSGTGLGAGLAVLAISRPAAARQAAQQQTQLPAKPDNPQQPQVARPRYDFEIDIVEGNCGPHKAGQKIKYPDEKGKICPWLMDSMSGAIRVLSTAGRCRGSTRDAIREGDRSGTGSRPSSSDAPTCRGLSSPDHRRKV
jgi:uncharacterized repeat protein (TIGR04076 family)